MTGFKVLYLLLLVSLLSCVHNRQHLPLKFIDLKWKDKLCWPATCEMIYGIENFDIKNTKVFDSITDYVKGHIPSEREDHSLCLIVFFKYDKSGEKGVNERMNIYPYTDWDYNKVLVAKYAWINGKFHDATFYDGETELFSQQHIKGL